jgi:hypothetical protein
VKAVEIDHSGDDGLDLTNSSIAMERVRVDAPTEDGLNLSTSTLVISMSLWIDMTDSQAADREIFDFEVDDGPTTITILPNARVDVRGYWDNRPGDLRIDVRSRDMPRPSLWTRSWYEFHGSIASNMQTDIFSVP